MANTRTRIAGLIPVGFQTMSLTNTTAVAINSTVRAARVLHVSVETVDARYRADGTAPTNTTGVLLTKALRPLSINYNGTSQFKIARAGASGTSTVHIMGYKYPGD